MEQNINAPQVKNENMKVIYLAFVLDVGLLIAAMYTYTSMPTCKIQDNSSVKPGDSVVKPGETGVKPGDSVGIREDSVATPEDSITFDNFKCGISNVEPDMNPSASRVIKNSWPWFARLRKRTGSNGHSKTPICAATVLTTHHVVSACQCVEHGVSPSDYLVSIGDFIDTYTGAKVLEVIKFRWHPRCILPAAGQYRARIRVNDILLVSLKTSLQFGNFVQPACLPEIGIAPTPAETCRIYYWTGVKYGFMQQFPAQILPQHFCSRAVDYALDEKNPPPFLDKKNFFCTKYYSGDKKCMQVSGGPLTCQQGGKWILYGVASWGLDCKNMNIITGIYSNISEYLSWICCFMQTHPGCRDIMCIFYL